MEYGNNNNCFANVCILIIDNSKGKLDSCYDGNVFFKCLFLDALASLRAIMEID